MVNINFFVRLVLGRPGFLLFLHSGSPANPGLSLGQSRFVPWTIPGTKGSTESLCEKSLCAFFARYILSHPISKPASLLISLSEHTSPPPITGRPQVGAVRLQFGGGTVRAVLVFGSGGSSAKRVFLCFRTVSQEWTVPKTVLVPGTWFRRFQLRFRFREKRFRRFRFPVPVRFLSPAIKEYYPPFKKYASKLHYSCITWLHSCFGIPPTPDRCPIPHFPEKMVSGSQNPHFLSFWKRGFAVKNPLFFSAREHMENGDFWAENSLYQPLQGWREILDPETLFSRKCGVGGIPIIVFKLIAWSHLHISMFLCRFAWVTWLFPTHLNNSGIVWGEVVATGSSTSILWSSKWLRVRLYYLRDIYRNYQESPQQTKPKKGPKRKVHEFRLFLWILVFFR